MYIRHGLIPLALLATSVSAFYPYSPSSSDSQPVESGLAPAAVKRDPFYPYTPGSGDATGDGGTPPIMRRGSRVKRDSSYTKVPAAQPTASNSMPVDNDGVDYSYFSTVKFGSSGKEMWMLIDTGSPNTWVFGSDCRSKSCLAHRTYGSSDSTTRKQTNTPWNVSYGSGGVNGTLVTDDITFAGLTLSVTFGSASIASDDFLGYPMDGILGLGRPGPAAQAQTVMQLLGSAKKLKGNLFGVNLFRASGGPNNGQINFGAVNTDLFTGSLNYNSVPTGDTLWEIPVDDAGVGGSSVGFTGKKAIIDTGTSIIFMPPNDANKLLSKLPGLKQDGENFECSCTATDPIQFTFNGVTYGLGPIDYLGPKGTDGLCALRIIGRQAFGPDQWLLGDNFLKTVYSVFDFDQNRIGKLHLHSTALNTQSNTYQASAQNKAAPCRPNPQPPPRRHPPLLHQVRNPLAHPLSLLPPPPPPPPRRPAKSLPPHPRPERYL